MTDSTTLRTFTLRAALAAALLFHGIRGADARAAGSASGEAAGDPPSRTLLRELASAPRLAGTCGSPWSAALVARWLEDAGFEVAIDSREVLLSLPRRIEIASYEGALDEHPFAERIESYDPDALPPGDLPMCNAWSASGTVKAAVIDAGHGTRADFERLRAIGLDPRGKIALVRYGRSYRGIKVDLAAQYGCVGVLLFTAGDGPEKGPVWPAGPWKPEWDAQRGSILPIAKVPGDPSTPGWASPVPGVEGARRTSGAELELSLPKIPCVPIGSGEARALIERLATVEVRGTDGSSQPERLGPGPVRVRMSVEQPRDLRTIHNVIARLAGRSEDAVIAGAHRDSWVRGAHDNGSGTVVLVRAAQELGRAARAGWKPEHTLMIALWDAEEYGLIGSTEWAEANAGWLREHAIAYVNMDAGISGARFGGASGSPGMLGVLRAVLERVPALAREGASGAATTPATLWEEWKESSPEPALSLPGGGSDFAVFAHHLALPVLEFGLRGSAGGGGYHTSFDDFALVDRFVDPGFAGHELAARVMTELLREISARGHASFDTIEALATWERVLAASAAPPAQDEDSAEAAEPLGIDGAKRRLAAALGTLAARAREHGVAPMPRFYRALEARDGLPGRPWFRNALWAPGLEDGYGSAILPSCEAALAAGPSELEAELASLLSRIEAWRSVALLEAPALPAAGN